MGDVGQRVRTRLAERRVRAEKLADPALSDARPDPSDREEAEHAECREHATKRRRRPLRQREQHQRDDDDPGESDRL